MIKKWQIYESNNEKIEEISQKYNLNKLLATILVNRNIEENQIETYLNPNRKNFHDPFLMPDMEIAVNRILKAMENHNIWRLRCRWNNKYNSIKKLFKR